MFGRAAAAPPSRRGRPGRRHYRPAAATTADAGTISILGSVTHSYTAPAQNSLNVPAGTVGNARLLIMRNFEDTDTISAVSGGGPAASGGGTGSWARVAGGVVDGSGSVREIWLGTIADSSTTISVTYSGSPATLTELMSVQLESTLAGSAVWARVGTQGAILDSTTPTTAPPFPSLTADAAGRCYVGHMAFWGSGSAGTTPGFSWYAVSNGNQVAINPAVSAGAVQPVAVQTSATAYAIGVLITDGS